jgi:hypothetical protein
VPANPFLYGLASSFIVQCPLGDRAACEMIHEMLLAQAAVVMEIKSIVCVFIEIDAELSRGNTMVATHFFCAGCPIEEDFMLGTKNLHLYKRK